MFPELVIEKRSSLSYALLFKSTIDHVIASPSGSVASACMLYSTPSVTVCVVVGNVTEGAAF